MPERLTHGWELNSGFSFNGGTPYTGTASSNVSGNGEGADRAVQVLSNPHRVDHSIVGGSVQWFSPAAFVDPAPGTYSPTPTMQILKRTDVAGLQQPQDPLGLCTQWNRHQGYSIWVDLLSVRCHGRL